MRFFPVGLDLRDRACLVVGGGEVGTRKVHSLLAAGASVTVVSPAVTEDIADEAENGRVRWIRAPFEPGHLDGARLVVAATDDPAVNERLAALARERATLLCDATSGDRSDLIFGALHQDDDVTVATFTDGRDPRRARQVRDRIAAWMKASRNGDAPEPAAADTLLVLVAHGSRNPDWGVPLEELTERLREGAATENVRLAYSQFATPTLEDVVDEAAASGIRRIRILPLFMTAHGHVDRDIRPVVDTLRRRHDTLEVEFLPPVGELPSFRVLLVELAREVTR